VVLCSGDDLYSNTIKSVTEDYFHKNIQSLCETVRVSAIMRNILKYLKTNVQSITQEQTISTSTDINTVYINMDTCIWHKSIYRNEHTHTHTHRHTHTSDFQY